MDKVIISAGIYISKKRGLEYTRGIQESWSPLDRGYEKSVARANELLQPVVPI